MITRSALIRLGQIALLCALAVMSFGFPSAKAAEGDPVATALTLVDGGTATIRDPLEFTVQLTDSLGNVTGAVDNEALELYIDHEHVRRTRTDVNGYATFTIRTELPAGTYDVQVLYNGSKTLQPSILKSEIKIQPAELKIFTIPSVADVKFTLGDQEFFSDETGIARIEVDRLGVYDLEAHPSSTPTRRVRFNRWQDEVFYPERQIDIKRVKALEVGFDLSYRVTTAFHDLDDLAVDPDRIERVVLRSSHGTESILEAPDLGTAESGSIWLQSGRVVRRFHGLEETQILWSVESVEIDGTNVVNRAQQRFFVYEEDTWNIQLLLYEAYFTARDALFGFKLGSGVNLEYPNGLVEEVDFSSEAEVTVQSLPRGEYRVNVAGAPGYSPYSPVALSRNQEVHLLVISYVDMAVALGLLTVLAISLLFVGRPSLLNYLRIPNRDGRLRHALIAICVFTLVLGVSILNFGLGKDPAQSHAHPAEPTPAFEEASVPSPQLFTTGDPDDSLVVDVYPESVLDDVYLDAVERLHHPPIAGVLQEFWTNNGGLAIFGHPIARTEKRTDPETGRIEISQDFDYVTLVYSSAQDGTDVSMRLVNLGSIAAEQAVLQDSEPFVPVADRPRPDDECRYIRQTNHFICGEFLAYWSSHGLALNPQANAFQMSVALFGYPISEPFEDPETGRTVQYFERARLEHFPELTDTPHVIQRSSLKGAQS